MSSVRTGSGELADQSAVPVIFHAPRPWSEIVDIAERYDLALVVGNQNPTQLPSKAVSYLQLPIPRLAVVRDCASDSLAAYVADKPGWLTLEAGARDIAARVHDHASRPWTLAGSAAAGDRIVGSRQRHSCEISRRSARSMTRWSRRFQPGASGGLARHRCCQQLPPEMIRAALAQKLELRRRAPGTVGQRCEESRATLPA